MNVLLINFNDITGGAARAVYRLHQGLRAQDINSMMLVKRKDSNDPTVLTTERPLTKATTSIPHKLDRLPLRLYPNRQRLPWGVNWVPHPLAWRVRRINPDIVNLHWVSGGFVPLNALSRFYRPLVWTLHDMWAFTGGCHYDQECGRFRERCGACPQLRSQHDYDVTRWEWKRKQRLWHDVPFTVIALSRWLAAAARASSLFRDRRIELIHNGLDLTRYKPLPRHIAREVLSLPQERKLIVFGAMSSTTDRRKGFQYLQPALQDLAAQGWHDQAEVVVFGAARPPRAPDFGLPTHYTGQLSDDISLALLYAAADVFVAPSVQDNLPNTVLEALACGTPSVGFDVGGIPDMIEHQQNGYLARPYEPDDLARGIAWVLADDERLARLSHRCREKAEQEFSQELQARRYRALYEDMLTQHQRRGASRP